MLAGKGATHLEARLVQQPPVDDAVGPSQVDELEDAQPLTLRIGLGRPE